MGARKYILSAIDRFLMRCKIRLDVLSKRRRRLFLFVVCVFVCVLFYGFDAFLSPTVKPHGEVKPADGGNNPGNNLIGREIVDEGTEIGTARKGLRERLQGEETQRDHDLLQMILSFVNVSAMPAGSTKTLSTFVDALRQRRAASKSKPMQFYYHIVKHPKKYAISQAEEVVNLGTFELRLCFVLYVMYDV